MRTKDLPQEEKDWLFIGFWGQVKAIFLNPANYRVIERDFSDNGAIIKETVDRISKRMTRDEAIEYYDSPIAFMQNFIQEFKTVHNQIKQEKEDES